MALIVFVIITVGAYWRLNSGDAKEIMIQVITAVGTLVTGYTIGRGRRSTDTEVIQDNSQDRNTLTITKTEGGNDPQIIKDDRKENPHESSQ